MCGRAPDLGANRLFQRGLWIGVAGSNPDSVHSISLRIQAPQLVGKAIVTAMRVALLIDKFERLSKMIRVALARMIPWRINCPKIEPDYFLVIKQLYGRVWLHENNS
jgi:hypothetical protein